MAKRLKRAFTITELVIVIAVVAILAAVLIPTFTNIVNKANESADTQLVKNLNTILSSEQTVSQEAAPTMSKALEQEQEGGYTVDKLTPTSDGDILWEQDSNRFVLVSDGKIIFKDSTTTASSTAKTLTVAVMIRTVARMSSAVCRVSSVVVTLCTPAMEDKSAAASAWEREGSVILP